MVFSNHNAADSDDNEADKNPRKAKIPIHILYIITGLTDFCCIFKFYGVK